MPVIKYCDYCGEPIIRPKANFHEGSKHYFCNNHCDAMYKRKLADAKNFKPIKNFDKYLKDYHRYIKYAVYLCKEYSINGDDVEDFMQVARITLWRLLSQGFIENNEKGNLLIASIKLAIKNYVQEFGRNQHGYLTIDPVFYANPEIITRHREIIRALDSSLFKELLAQTLSSKSNERLAEEFGTSKTNFILRCHRQRERLKELMEYE